MFNLILKDLYITRKIHISFIASFLLLAIAQVVTKSFMLYTFSMSLYMIYLYSFSHNLFDKDDKNNSIVTLLSLPVDRNYIIYSRYISFFLLFSISTLINSIYNYIVLELGIITYPDSIKNILAPGSMSYNLYSTTLSICISIFVFSILFPLLFGFKNLKSHVSMIPLIFALYTMFNYLKIYVSQISFDKSILAILCIILCLLIYALSAYISTKMLKRRRLF